MATLDFKSLISPFTNLFKSPTANLTSPQTAQTGFIGPVKPKTSIFPSSTTYQTYGGYNVPITPTADLKKPLSSTFKTQATPSNLPYNTNDLLAKGNALLASLGGSNGVSAEDAAKIEAENAAGATSAAAAAKNKSMFGDLSPETFRALQLAQNSYEQSLKLSPAELSTQEDLDRLIASTKAAFTGTEDKAIPLEFITGQLSSIEKRANTLAEPLQSKLARLQAQRQSSLEASRFALDRADKQAETERSAAENARTMAAENERFNKEFGLKSDALAEDKKRGALSDSLSERKFEEDKRQFGLNYALDARRVAIDEAKAAADAAGQKDVSSMLGNVQLVNDIISNAGTISGPIQTGSIPFTSGSATANKYNQLKGLLALDKRSALKGSGAISDYESRTLDRSASALGRNLSEAEFAKELKKIRGVFTTAAGLEAIVKVTSPSGETITSTASRAEIDELLREGNNVEYD